MAKHDPDYGNLLRSAVHAWKRLCVSGTISEVLQCAEVEAERLTLEIERKHYKLIEWE